MPSTYDVQAKVRSFTNNHGEFGTLVLRTFNTVDPLQCYYGDDCNPDEYVGYATRFITSIEGAFISLNRPDRKEVLRSLALELLRRSFYAAQIAEGRVSEVAIIALRDTLFQQLELAPSEIFHQLQSGGAC